MVSDGGMQGSPPAFLDLPSSTNVGRHRLLPLAGQVRLAVRLTVSDFAGYWMARSCC